MKNLTFFLFSLVVLCFSEPFQAQVEETSWNSFRVRVPAENGMSFDIKPTIRFRNTFYSEYDNASLDLVIRKKFSDHWTGAFLIRPWWMSEGKNRFFAWPIVVYNQNFGKLKFKTRFFYHHAFNLDFDDADFLRVRPELSHALSDKVSAALAIEPFFLLNDFNEISRVRYEFGMTYKFSPNLNLNINYWFEDQTGVWDERADFNTILTTLTYILKPQPKPGE